MNWYTLWWRCPVCTRTESTRALRARQRAVTDLYYPGPS